MPLKIDETLRRSIAVDLSTPSIAPFLGGEAGIGKTSLFKALEEDPAYKVFAIQANTLSDKGDLAGPRIVATTAADGSQTWEQVFFPHTTVREANAYAKAHPEVTVVLLVDEINRTDSDVTSSILSLQTERRCGNVFFEPNLRLAFTGNLKGNVTVLDSASLTRFSLYEVEPDAQTFIEVIEAKKELYPLIKEVLTEHPEYIFIKPSTAVSATIDEDDEDGGVTMDFLAESQEMVQHTTPRTLEALSDWLFGVDDEYLASLASTEVTTGPNGTGRKIRQLMVILQGKTGDTAFTDALAEKIVNRLSTASTVPTAPALVRPAVWNTVVADNTRSGIRNRLQGLPAEELVNIFLYALATPHNPTAAQAVVSEIVGEKLLESLDGDALTKFVHRGTGGDLNQATLGYLYTLNGPLVESLSSVRALMGVA